MHSMGTSAASVAAPMTAPSGPLPATLSTATASSSSSNNANMGNGSGSGGAGTSTEADTSSASGTGSQSGPPYLCPTCQTSYSRLEYLRRHERRHADIRPFVCDCGKGFSRSDVLSRHKRQCAVHLSGGTADDDRDDVGSAMASASNSAANTKKAPSRARKSNGAATRPRKGSSNSASRSGSSKGDGGDASGDNNDGNRHYAAGAYPGQRGAIASGPVPPQPYPPHPMASMQQQGSFPFPLQPGMQSGVSQAGGAAGGAPLMPPAPYGGADGGGMSGQGGSSGAGGPSAGQGGGGTVAGSPFGSGMSHHLSALNNFVNQQHNYPSSPESNGTVSQHGSPRFVARDMSRHGSNSSRFSLRKSGGSFDHIGPRTSAMHQSASQQYTPDFWDALDPAAKTASTVPGGTDFVSAATTAASQPSLNLSDTTGTGGFTSAAGINGLNTPRGEPQRFAVSTGPLSPFSSIALNSTMSPYLSAFSNARDTPFVASPGRGVVPGTPGSSLNVFDWTMRPPSKPASSAVKRESGTQQQQQGSSTQSTSSQPQAPTTSTASQPQAPTTSTASPSAGKRKREEDDASRKSPRLLSLGDMDSVDADHRSAAELLDSLRKSGQQRPPTAQPVAADISAAATSASGASSAAEASAYSPSSRHGDAKGVLSQGSATSAPPHPALPDSSAVSSSAPANFASTTASATSAAQATAENSAPTDTGQSFFDQGNVTMGPEAFLLRLQQGSAQQQQSARSGETGPVASIAAAPRRQIDANFQPESGSATATKSGAASGQNALIGEIPQSMWDAMLSKEGWFTGTPKAGTNVSPGLGSIASSLPATGTTPLSAGMFDASTNWLMSPGVQQIINSFAPQPGDFGSYFAGATGSATGTPAGVSKPTLPPATTALQTTAITPAQTVSQTTKTGNEDGTGAAVKIASAPFATPSLEVSTQALERALVDPKNPFYIPSDLFKPCFSVPHWNLPSITRLSMLALHAQQNLLKHIPIIHEPTFRLDTTPGCVTFAMCMLGCHEHGRRWWIGEEVVPLQHGRHSNGASKALPITNGKPVAHDNEETELTCSRYDEEDGQVLVRPIVMIENTNMLMRSFTLHARSDNDKVSIVQVLLLFQAARFLNHSASTRSLAASVHPSFVGLARQAGIFDAQAVHFERQINYTAEEVLQSAALDSADHTFSHSSLPSFLPGLSDDEKLWRRWQELAGRRRTAFSIFAIDTVAHLDASIPLQVQLSDLKDLPLPSPDTIWRAPNVESWKQALEKYRGPTFGSAMRELLGLTPKSSTNSESRADGVKDAPDGSNVSIQGRHGPFARLTLAMALLRGVLHFADMQGRRALSDRPSLLQEYTPGTQHGSTEEAEELRAALRRWRTAWDQDDLCLAASGPAGRQAMAQMQRSDSDMSFLGSHHLFASQTASSATALMDDALPFYWVACVVLAQATAFKGSSPDGTQAGRAHVVAEARKRGYLETRESEFRLCPQDFRSLLSAAKAFVNDGEQP